MIISNIYKRAFNVLSKMPFKLWGLSLLSSLLTILVLVFGVLPIVIVPVIAVLSAGMAAVYLDGFNGKEVYSDQLFKGFKDFWRTARRYVIGKSYGFHLVLSSDWQVRLSLFQSIMRIHSHRIYLMKKNR